MRAQQPPPPQVFRRAAVAPGAPAPSRLVAFAEVVHNPALHAYLKSLPGNEGPLVRNAGPDARARQDLFAEVAKRPPLTVRDLAHVDAELASLLAPSSPDGLVRDVPAGLEPRYADAMARLLAPSSSRAAEPPLPPRPSSSSRLHDTLVGASVGVGALAVTIGTVTLNPALIAIGLCSVGAGLVRY